MMASRNTIDIGEPRGFRYRRSQMDPFVATMPAAYERLYGPQEAAEHRAIVARRGAKLVHAELWQSLKGPLLCVVADDRPGLLALVTDALLAQGIAIQSARAFCREVGKERVEAVDFLGLRGPGGSEGLTAQLDGDVLEAFERSLSELIAEDMEPRTSSPSHPPPLFTQPTRVYFERQSLAEGSYLLVVDAPDSDGLLHAVSSALHEKGMRITTCEIRTIDGRASDRFEIESSPPRSLKDTELCDIQLAVRDALPRR